MAQRTNRKTHYKMYKKGRFWVFAGITAFTWQINTIAVHADTTTNAPVTTSQISNTTANESTAKITNATSDETTANTTSQATSTATSASLAATSSVTAVTATSDSATTNTASQATSATSQQSTAKVTVSNATMVTGTTSTATSDSTATNTASQETSATSQQSTAEVTASNATTVADTTTKTEQNQSTPQAGASDTIDTTTQTTSNATVATDDKTTATDDLANKVGSATTSDDTTISADNSANASDAVDNPLTATPDSDTSSDDQTTSSDTSSITTIDTTATDSNTTDTANNEVATSALTTKTIATTPIVMKKSASLVKAATATDIASGTYGNSAWRIDSDGILHISSGTFADTSGKNPWAAYATDIKEIIFENTVNGAADSSGLFRDLTKLTTITNANNFKTSQVTKINSMFANDSALTSLDISQWDTSNITNMASLFHNVSSLKSLDISAWQTGKVTNMGALFDTATSLTSLDLNNWDTSNVTNMAGMFFGDTSLVSVSAADWNTSKVTSMRSLFSGATALTTIDVSNWDMSNVTDIAFMFSNNTSLVTLNVSKWNVGNVTNMNSLFNGDRVLANIDVSDWDTSSVTDMGYTFYNTKFTSLDVSKWNTSNVTTMVDMFCGNTKIQSLDVSKWDTSNVINMSYMFYGCNVLAGLDVSNLKTGNVTDMSHMFDGANHLTSLATANWDTSNVTNMSYMFYLATGLASLDVANWDTSNVTNMTYMFYAANALVSLNVANWNTSNVTDMSYMFNSTWLLQALDVANWNTSNVTNMQNMFAYNETLTYLDTSKWDTSNVTNMSGMFVGAFNLKTLDVSNWNTSNVQTMYDMFDGDVALSVLDVSKWDTSNVTNMQFMFWGNSGLKKLDFSNWDMSKVTSTSKMLTNTNLATLILGAKNKWSSDTGLPDLTADQTYTGNWISNNGNTATSSELLTNNIAGTYIHERINSQTTLTTNDSQLVAGPATSWNVNDGFSGTDYDGNPLTLSDVTVSGDTVDTTKAGVYNVTYTYTDATGKSVTKTATITVTTSTAAVETTDQTVELGDTWNAENQFSGVDTDGSAIDFNQVTVSGDTIDTKTPGTYNVTYSFKDSAGNTITKTVQVVVYGIILNETSKEISTTSNWDPTANVKQATDQNGDSLNGSDLIIIIKDANGNTVTTMNKPGTYTVTYSFASRARSAETYSVSATITVTSQANIDLTTDNTTIKPGNTFNAEDYYQSGTDENGDTLDFSQITVSGDTVNTDKPGNYTVTYTYRDAAGNEVSQSLNVTVSDSQSSLDVDDSTVQLGDTWNPATNFNSAVNADGTTSVDFKDVTVSGDTVNTKVPGTYNVTYSFTDITGKLVTKSIKVIVYGIILNETDKAISTTSNWDPSTNIKQASNQNGDNLTSNDLVITIKDANGNTVTHMNKPGTYTVTYSFSDNTYSTSATVTVTSQASVDLTTDRTTIKPGSTFNAEDYYQGGTDENGDTLDFSNVSVSGDTVNSNKPGTYTVIYTYRDAAGNEVSKTLKVTVSDSQSSLDVDDSAVQLGDNWNPETNFNGAVNADGTTSVDFKDVTVSGDTVNTKVPGTYNVTYSFTDSTGQLVTKTVKVIVYGIVLNETSKEISTTSNWDPATNVQKATDGAGNNLTGRDLVITITDANGNAVNVMTKPGTYTVTYSFVTRSGENYTTTATVVVSNKASLNVSDSTITAGDNWHPEDNFVSGTNENGDSLNFNQVTIDGKVDTTTPGTYKVTYHYADANGNQISKTITVTVTAKDTGNGDGGTDTGDNNGDGDTNTDDNDSDTDTGNNNGDGDTNTDDNDGNGDTGNNNGDGDTNTDDNDGDTDTGNNNGDGDTNTDDSNGDTDTDSNNNGNGDTNTGSNSNNGSNGNSSTTSNQDDAVTEGNQNTATVSVKPTATTPEDTNTSQVSLKVAANKAHDSDQLPQTNEQSSRKIATSGLILLALSSLIFGLGKVAMKRRQD